MPDGHGKYIPLIQQETRRTRALEILSYQSPHLEKPREGRQGPSPHGDGSGSRYASGRKNLQILFRFDPEEDEAYVDQPAVREISVSTP